MSGPLMIVLFLCWACPYLAALVAPETKAGQDGLMWFSGACLATAAGVILFGAVFS